MKEILANAFYSGSPGQSWVGLWSHPRSEALNYTSLEFWSRLARTCEQGLLDGVFFADALGVRDVYKSSPAGSLRTGSFAPALDPMMLIPAMAAVTRNLTFGVTGNASYETPYLLARRLSTLDHLTGGRLAWNVVTGTIEAASRAVGQSEWIEHDKRYEALGEYMELMYKLWECSWEDGAVVRDRSTGTYADPERIHVIDHNGPCYKCHGVHLCEPSPQRTPLIVSAGSSSAGMEFLARHAECAFIAGSSKDKVAASVRDIRARVAACGRDPSDVKVFLGMTIVAAPTEAEARDLRADYARYCDVEGMLAFKSGYIGVDLSKYALDDPLPSQNTNASQSALKQYTSQTVRDLASFAPMPGQETFLIGSTQQVCDEIMGWVRDTDIDGINLMRTVEPEGLESFCRLVVPELQNRGVYKTAYREGTLRQKMFGRGDRVAPTHPAAQLRDAVLPTLAPV